MSYPLIVAFQGSSRSFEIGDDLSSWQLSLSSMLVSLFPDTFRCMRQWANGDPQLPRLPKQLRVIFALQEKSFEKEEDLKVKRQSLESLAKSLEPLNIAATYAASTLTGTFITVNSECDSARWCRHTMIVEHDWFFLPSRIPFSAERLMRILEEKNGVSSIRFRKTNPHGHGNLWPICRAQRLDLGDIADNWINFVPSDTLTLAKVPGEPTANDFAFQSVLSLDGGYSNNPRMANARNEVLIYQLYSLKKNMDSGNFEKTVRDICYRKCSQALNGTSASEASAIAARSEAFDEKWTEVYGDAPVLREDSPRPSVDFLRKAACGLYNVRGLDYRAFHMDGKIFNFEKYVHKFNETDTSYRHFTMPLEYFQHTDEGHELKVQPWKVLYNTTEEMIDFASSLEVGLRLPMLVPPYQKKLNDGTVGRWCAEPLRNSRSFKHYVADRMRMISSVVPLSATFLLVALCCGRRLFQTLISRQIKEERGRSWWNSHKGLGAVFV